jgi:hypothetical protein
MKKIILLIFISLAAGGVLFAQTRDRQNRGPGFPGAPPEKISISGDLQLIQGMIALNSGNITYYIMGIGRLAGFIDGLKEGASVTLEGYVRAHPRDPETRFFRAVKLTLNGKNYDLSPALGEAPGGFREFEPEFQRGWDKRRRCHQGERGHWGYM